MQQHVNRKISEKEKFQVHSQIFLHAAETSVVVFYIYTLKLFLFTITSSNKTKSSFHLKAFYQPVKQAFVVRSFCVCVSVHVYVCMYYMCECMCVCVFVWLTHGVLLQCVYEKMYASFSPPNAFLCVEVFLLTL